MRGFLEEPVSHDRKNTNSFRKPLLKSSVVEVVEIVDVSIFYALCSDFGNDIARLFHPVRFIRRQELKVFFTVSTKLCLELCHGKDPTTPKSFICVDICFVRII